MASIKCPYCPKRVNPERLEKHFSGRRSCRKKHKKYLRGVASESSSENEEGESEDQGELRHQPLSAAETASIAEIIGFADEVENRGAMGENEVDLLAELDLSPAEIELLQQLDRAAEDADLPPRPDENGPIRVDFDAPIQLDLDQEMADIQVEIADEPREPIRTANPRRTHGYATIEVHRNAARVYRWHFEDERPGDSVLEDDLHKKKIFELCEWIMRVPISTAERAEFLNMEINRANLSRFKKPSDLYKHLDTMEHGPEWKDFTLTIETEEGRETFVIYRRCPLEVIRYLIRQKRFNGHMNYGPERHWTITLDGRKIRVYSEMWTGDWWWRMQNLLGEGATLAPFILATDATQMTKLSGSKVAWPVYGSIGNIGAHVRRRPSEHAMVLIGYLPVAKLNWITNADKRRQERWKLYHSALAMILEPLKAPARDGVEMVCADGGIRRVHPILATHLGDWPEMCLFGTCRKNGCPVCVADVEEIQVLEPAARLRTKAEVLSAFRYARQGYSGMQAGLLLRPTWPYWALHPWASGPGMIVPDLLHQLWKGVFLDQIRPWWTKLIGSPEMDQRYASVPRYSTLRHFRSGLAGIAQWTGNEAKTIAKSFLATVAGDTPEMGVEAARSLMDFIFRARQPQLDEDDLACLNRDLRYFHETREIFITRGAYSGEDFNDFSKMHMLGHYTHQIREWGAPDGYNTEGPERLHIEYVKIPYGTTNGVEPEPQMTLYLQRIEALCIRRAELERDGIIDPRKRRYRPEGDPSGAETQAETDGYSDQEDESDGEEPVEERVIDPNGREGIDPAPAEPRERIRPREHHAFHPDPQVSIAIAPTQPVVTPATIVEQYHAPDFLDALRLYLETRHVDLAKIIIDEPSFGVYHKLKLIHPPLPFDPLSGTRNELVRASPARLDDHGLVRRDPFFDTVLIEHNRFASGLQRYCPARVLVIFQLHRRLLKQHAQVMAYVELFEEFPLVVPEQHGLPVTKPLHLARQRARIVIPVTDIRLTCHLLPDYAALRREFPDRRWDSSTDVLSMTGRFFLNQHVNYFFFSLMDHWRRIYNHHQH